MSKLASSVTILCVGASVLAAAAYAATSSSTAAGAFSAAQAERGKAVYEKSCKNCHQQEFYQDRLVRWQKKSVGELFEVVSTSMPADNVGALTTSEYLDVLAYVFSITGSKPGDDELTTDTMDGISIAAAN